MEKNDSVDVKAIFQTIGSQSQQFRNRLGLTQVDVAQRLGMSRVSVSNFERGLFVTLSVLIRLSDLYGVPLRDFMPSGGNTDCDGDSSDLASLGAEPGPTGVLPVLLEGCSETEVELESDELKF
jgi:transcriptional regulator with XRE-family HTH domain